MSTAKTLQISSTSSEQTEQLGEQLGRRLKGGEVIELLSDLGGGKTTFVRGLARGMGSHDQVSSPTFTISQVYKANNLELHHFDLYRLNETGLISHELQDVMLDPDIVTVFEWGGIIQNVLPEQRLKIIFKPVNENERQVTLSAPESLNYLVDKLC